MSRTRSERIRSTILGRDEGPIRCPRVLHAGLRFRKEADPVHVIYRVLERAGFDSPEDLREAFDLPATALICQPLPDGALRQMNGDGIWRAPGTRGVGAHPYEAIVRAADSPVRAWQRAALALLKRYALPDTRSRLLRDDPLDYRIPVLSTGDRRAFLRSLWDPFLPEANWRGHQRRPEGTTQVYLDVSGSMNAEMPHIVALLAQLGARIRRPLWAFSDVVAPAKIVRGQLKAQTSGGTSMQCVIEHLARTRPAAAIVLTDGYIETLPRKLIATIDGIRLHVLVTRDGNPAQIARAGLPYTQLEKLPTQTRFTERVTT